MQPTMERYTHSVLRERADEELGLFCYTSGISFLSLENPHFTNFCKTLNPGYNPPSRRVLSSSMLDEADRKVTEWKRNTLDHELICLTSDGYTNKAQVNLVNFEALIRLGPVHWHTTQRTAAEIWKDAAYVSGVILEQVHQLGGTENVVGFVSDNENLMVSVWKILMARLESFMCVPCLAHIQYLICC
jgi:hypothetical protein